MKIKNIFSSSFRTRQARRLRQGNSLNFEEFYNDAEFPTARRFPSTGIKESSFDNVISPNKLSPSNYTRFTTTHDESDDIDINNSSRPSLSTILLFIILSAVFLILPIIYLLNCFDIIYEHQNLKHNPIVLPTTNTNKDHFIESNNNNIDQNHEDGVKKTLPNPPKPDYGQCRILKNEERFDCYPENGANQGNCEARGCCWIPAKIKPKKIEIINIPYCFYPANYESYKFLNVSETAYGLVGFLNRTYKSAYPDDVEIIKIIVRYETENRLHVKFLDAKNQRFEPPYPEVPLVDRAAENLNYIFELDLFKAGFKVVRKSDNTTLFDSMNFMGFIFANQFLQFSSKLPSKFIYGLGDHATNLLLNTHWTRYTLWNHDIPPIPNENLYGSHPFYMLQELNGNSHGVFLLNSNAMDVILQPTPAITFRTIGGILNFYFFTGPTPSNVISQYTELIGRSFMPPYWSLGFHLCRFGYKTLNDTRSVLEKNLKAGIFIDTQWNDLDYMNNSNDFTYDRENYKDLPQFVEELHKNGMHYIPLIDPGVSASEPKGAYPPYDIGIKMDIFVKNSSGQPFVGKVWNSHSTVWPDFTHPNTVDYWTEMLKNFHNEVKYDGAWIDMNEPSNFLSGSFNGCPKSSNFENPPYIPGIDGGSLYFKTLCMSAKHYAGLHYDVHNLFGITEAIITSFALAEIRGKRPVAISRSTFPGLGHYSGHWSGDVFSTWDGLKQSIPHMLSFSLFGIPLMGADICGFNGNSTVALCNRWQQLGAFYPFSRNHNTDDGIPQDPVSMGDLVVASTRKALKVRYELLPYLYLLFYRAHVYGETVARPVFFEFYDDPQTVGIDTEFLWGSAVLIIPVLKEGAVTVNGYLPKGLWYDYYTRKLLLESSGEIKEIDAPLDTIPVLIRGGTILPQQEAKSSTTQSRTTNIQLLIAPDENDEAFGEFYWDDGDSLNTVEEKHYSLIEFNAKNGTLFKTLLNWAEEFPPNLGSIQVLGVKNSIKEVLINGNSAPFMFNQTSKYLFIHNLDIYLENPLEVTWK